MTKRKNERYCKSIVPLLYIDTMCMTKERKRGICVPVDGATVDACKLRVVDSAVGKRFVVVLDGGGVIIGSEAEE